MKYTQFTQSVYHGAPNWRAARHPCCPQRGAALGSLGLSRSLHGIDGPGPVCAPIRADASRGDGSRPTQRAHLAFAQRGGSAAATTRCISALPPAPGGSAPPIRRRPPSGPLPACQGVYRCAGMRVKGVFLSLAIAGTRPGPPTEPPEPPDPTCDQGSPDPQHLVVGPPETRSNLTVNRP